MARSSFDASRDYLAANLRRLRAGAGFTQESMAEKTDLDLSYYLRIERCKANPSLRVVCTIADALGVAPARLLRKTASVKRVPGRPRGR